MKRREFITLLGGAAAAVATWHPLAAQQAGRIYRVGFFGGAPDSGVMALGYPAFRDEMRKHGFIDGRNLVLEFRSTRQEAARLHADTVGPGRRVRA